MIEIAIIGPFAIGSMTLKKVLNLPAQSTEAASIYEFDIEENAL